MGISYVVLAVLASIVAVVIHRVLLVGQRPGDLPPGPPTIPILGNIHQIPSRDVHLQLEKWAQQYGDVYSLILGTKTLIVLSSDTAVKELLDRRSATYSDRQEMYIGQELCSDGLRMLMMRYGPQWRGIRKMMHNLLNRNTAENYIPYQILENKQMLYDLLTTPDDFLRHIRRYSNALTTSMVFGWRTPTYEDAAMKQLFDGFTEFAEINSTGAAALVDFFPLLRKLPDFVLTTSRRAKKLHQAERALYIRHWLRAKADIRSGSARQCFCVGMAETQEKEGFDDAQAAYISGTLLEAGSDTTSNTLYSFVLAMLLYPEVQRHAQNEIDRVCGESRLPNVGDEGDLPYIRCVMKETLRWLPTTILGGVPHATTTEDHYNGFRIPKGAGVINNVWAINMDPKRAPNPRLFDPSRYTDDELSLFDSASNSDASKRDTFNFGAGRRICPGIHVAERSLFLAMSRILWAFDILPTLDRSGREVLPDPARVTQGFVCMPEEYAARIQVRSQKRAGIIREQWQRAEESLLNKITKQWINSPIEDA